MLEQLAVIKSPVIIMEKATVHYDDSFQEVRELDRTLIHWSREVWVESIY